MLNKDQLISKLKNRPDREVKSFTIGLSIDSDIEKLISEMTNDRVLLYNGTSNIITKLDNFYKVIEFKDYESWKEYVRQETLNQQTKIETEIRVLKSTLLTNITSISVSIASFLVALITLVVFIYDVLCNQQPTITL